ncbi:30893_t:CDS:1, partial [Racocetra persica]
EANSVHNTTTSTSSRIYLPWTISSKMHQIIYKFENEILCQFPC